MRTHGSGSMQGTTLAQRGCTSRSSPTSDGVVAGLAMVMAALVSTLAAAAAQVVEQVKAALPALLFSIKESVCDTH